ncbi:MAG: acetate--CoA ligase family protein [Halobacteriales archaeon]
MTADALEAYAEQGLEWLNEHEARTVLREYDIPCSADAFLPYEAGKAGADYLEDLEAADDAPGFPLYAKVAARDIASVSDAGGVERVGSADEFAAVAERLLDNVADAHPDAAIQGLLATEDVGADRRELFLGAADDPQFGTVLSLGVGGIYVEVYRDVAFRVPPVEEADVRSMLDTLEGRAVLGSFRGMDPVDEDALVDAVLSFARLLEDHPEITEADVNPLMVGADGVVAADALIRLG